MKNHYEHITDDDLQKWIEQFDRDGFLFLPRVLIDDHIQQLKEDLDRDLANPNSKNLHVDGHDDLNATMRFRVRLFEVSKANLRLFDMDPIARFAEMMLDPPHTLNMNAALNTHVVHNNSFINKPSGAGLAMWHQDDPPHYEVTHGEPPTNVRLPCLFFTANYYLTDVTETKHGPTEVVRGSHLIGRTPPQELEKSQWADRIVSCLGPAGSVVMFNNQVWHRGAPNLSEHTRYITQVTYGRRMINPMYYPFMGYRMPEHVYQDADARLKRLLGFLPHGPYA